MKRVIWWTFTVAAAISAAMLIMYVAGVAYLVWFKPAWLHIFLSAPLRSFRPVLVDSILPTAWIIIRQRRRHAQFQGFEPVFPTVEEQPIDRRANS